MKRGLIPAAAAALLASPALAALQALPQPAAPAPAPVDPPGLLRPLAGFPDPPAGAFEAGVLMELRNEIGLLIVAPERVAELCGLGVPACPRFEPNGFCTIVVDWRLAPLEAGVLERHLLARCAGWSPD